MKWTTLIGDTFFCSTGELQNRFVGTADEGEPRYSAAPPSGVIRIEYANNQKRAGFFKASRLDAPMVTSCLADWESHAPEVVYQVTGIYPRYQLSVKSGGCGKGKLNCQN